VDDVFPKIYRCYISLNTHPCRPICRHCCAGKCSDPTSWALEIWRTTVGVVLHTSFAPQHNTHSQKVHVYKGKTPPLSGHPIRRCRRVTVCTDSFPAFRKLSPASQPSTRSPTQSFPHIHLSSPVPPLPHNFFFPLGILAIQYSDNAATILNTMYTQMSPKLRQRVSYSELIAARNTFVSLILQ
jgi:hypothetical protein